MGPRTYRLTGPDGRGAVGGGGVARRPPPSRIDGRLDCPGALRSLAQGHYARHRVFFAGEPAAVAAGYRPCARCLPAEYAAWKARKASRQTTK
jgi:hypothetical protein